MINYDEELRNIFGSKYQGCTQEGDKLIEYRLQPGKAATAGELAQVDALPKGMRAEIDNINATLVDYATLKARVEILEKK